MNMRVSEISKNPIFSIILPTRNRPDTFLRAVSSIVRQSFQAYELIVIDDFSSSNYAESICGNLTIPYKLIVNDSALGAAASRNAGIAAANGTYISFLDDDDEFSNLFLESTYERLHGTTSDIGLSWCSVKCIDYPDNPEGALIQRSRIFGTSYASRTELFEQFLSIGTGFGVTIKASCLKQVGLFNSDLKTGSDTDLFLRILSNGFSPVVIGEERVTIHNHRTFRLTDEKMHSTRVEDCRNLLRAHADFLTDFQPLRRKLENHLALLEQNSSALQFA